MSQKFFRTTLTVEVISEECPVSELGLADIAREIAVGGCSGEIKDTRVEQLTPGQAAQALINQGSDPAFFDLGDVAPEAEAVPEIRGPINGAFLARLKNLENATDVPVRYIRVLAAEYERIETENVALRQERAMRLADAERVCAWIDDPKRKAAVLSFTEGAERQIAYRFEGLLKARPTRSPAALRGKPAVEGAPQATRLKQLEAEFEACGGRGVELAEEIDRLREEIKAAGGAEILPGATREEVASVMLQDIVGDYDVPENVPEWGWVEREASFSHVRNGQDGVWEFVLNLSRQFADIPDRLRPVIDRARRGNLAYLIFHQGT